METPPESEGGISSGEPKGAKGGIPMRVSTRYQMKEQLDTHYYYC